MMEKVNSVCISVVCEAGRRIVDWVGENDGNIFLLLKDTLQIQ